MNTFYFSIPIFQKPRACLKNITLSLNLLNKTNILILEFFCIVQEVEAASAKMNKLQGADRRHGLCCKMITWAAVANAIAAFSKGVLLALELLGAEKNR